MSYILDALKKAEQERGGGQLNAVTTGYVPPAPYRNRWWLAAALLLCMAGAIAFLQFYPKRNGQVRPRSGAAGQPDAAHSVPKPPDAPSDELPESGRPRLNALTPETKHPPARVSPVAEDAPEEPVPGVSHPTPPKPAAVDPIQDEPAPAVAIPSQPEAPPAAAEDHETPPVPLQKAISKMKLTVLLYSDSPAERLVFINSRKYAEGDLVEGVYLLERITAEGAELSYRGERALLRP